MRQAMLAHVAPAPLEIVGLQTFGVMHKAGLDPAGDVVPVNGEHRLDVVVPRRADR